jgi:hypothetical protein
MGKPGSKHEKPNRSFRLSGNTKQLDSGLQFQAYSFWPWHGDNDWPRASLCILAALGLWQEMDELSIAPARVGE